MPLETVKLTASFKLDGDIDVGDLNTKYKSLVNELLGYASSKNVTGFKRLKAEKYHELRRRYPDLPSHYIYTACQMAASMYRSFRKLKRRGLVKADKPLFKRDAVMLDDHLFTLNMENYEASIATGSGRATAKLLHGTYHGKFRNMKVGQAWLVKREDSYYLNVVFSRTLRLAEPSWNALAVDINESNVTFGSEKRIAKLETGERAIRTAYFLKRRRVQSTAGRFNGNKIMAKYRGRETRRIETIYHNAANEVVKHADAANATCIVLERLTDIRRSIKYSKELNGRLHRWSFRRLQSVIEYKAKMKGINVVYVNPRGTSTMCPVCRVKLTRSPSGYRLMKCRNCGLEEDRDVVAVRNLLLLNYQRDVPSSSVQGESSPMTPSARRENLANYGS